MKPHTSWFASLSGLALVCALGLAGCGGSSDTGQGTGSVQERMSQAGQAVDDTAITTKVMAELAAQKEVDGSHISVTTTQGRVTLSGTVPPTQIALAEEIVRQIDGVKDVENKLQPADKSS